MRLSLCLALAAFASDTAFAADPPTIDLFGTTYRVQKFDYTQELTFPDPISPTNTVAILTSESFRYIGGDHFLIGADDLDFFGTVKNVLIEARFKKDASGGITGMEWVRTIYSGDPGFVPASPYDLDPSGIAVNTGTTGYAAGGNILVGSGGEEAWGLDFQTGADLPGPFLFNPPTLDLEDVVYVPDSATDGRYFVVDQCGRIDIFTSAGVPAGSFPIAGGLDSNVLGEAKGVAYLEDTTVFPQPFHGVGGVILISLDDNGPALEAYDRNGNQIATAPLTDDGTPAGNPILDPGGQPLAIEACGVDPVSGRIFLQQQGGGGPSGDLADNFIWVLSPCEEHFGTGCPTGAGSIPTLEIDGCVDDGSFVNLVFDAGVPNAIGLLVLGTNKASLPMGFGCVLNTAPLLPVSIAFQIPASGVTGLSALIPQGLPAGGQVILQGFVSDQIATSGFASTRGLRLIGK